MKINYLSLFVIVLFSFPLFSQIPLLNSNPTITNKVIYLDFDGEIVSGTGWNSGNAINALPSTLSIADIRLAFQRVAEDFRPFDVNITTDVLRFNNAVATSRMRVIITPTSAWYGSAGGVAYLNCFNWGGNPGTPCWVFENQLGYNSKYVAEACSHEAGHTLTLKHQSTYSTTPTCTKTAEYNPGQGAGVTSWAPIMGVSYYKNVSTWYNGTNSQSCNTLQNDHGSVNPGLTTSGYLNFLTDDVGNTYSTGKTLNLNSVTLLDSGLISTPSDVDVYRFTICNTRHVTFAVKPWALDTVNYNGANLDVRFQLFDAVNTLLLTDTSLTNLQTLAAASLTAGSYYFTIDGGGSVNYSDYGSLGKYYITLKATNPPALSNTIITTGNICTGQSATLSYTSNGSPNSWLWTVAGASTSTYNVQNPSLTFNSSQIYTVTLLATSSTSASCLSTQTLNIGALPLLSITPTPSVCPGANVQISANGASSYTWLPGNAGGASQIISPTVAITYTVFGSNGLCTNSAVTTVSVYPDFTPSVSASNTLICPGYSTALVTTGGTSYTYIPNSIVSSTAIVSPTVTTNYLVLVSNGTCVKQVSKLITVTPEFTITAATTPTLLCPNVLSVLSASNALSYTFFPGNINAGSNIAISPSVTTNYTIVGSNGVCTHTTIKTVNVANDFTINATGFNTIACPGKSVAILLSGASLYTFNPGGITSSSAVVIPQNTGNYSIIATDGYCFKSVVKTLTVNPDFNLQVVSSPAIFCPGKPVSLTASGATAYTVDPGNITSNPAIVSPTASSVYTITGSDGTCRKSVTQSLIMRNTLNLNVTVSDTLICPGEVISVKATGAGAYTINPGNSFSSFSFFTPTVTTTYTVTGNDGFCLKEVTKQVTVSLPFTLLLLASDTVFCKGDTISLSAGGAVNYTFNPGATVSSSTQVSPQLSTTYTLTGANADNCLTMVTKTLLLADCNYTGLKTISENHPVKIYPNPASTELNISTSAVTSAIEVTDAIGRPVFTGHKNPEEVLRISTMNWSQGLYFVKIYFTNHTFKVEKVIVRN